MKLFAVMLGGTAPGANTELHDAVFAAGETIADTYEQLMKQWFGSLAGLHIDSWLPLEIVDGHRVRLRPEAPAAGASKLWFINLGAYRRGRFGELHEVAFLVAGAGDEVKARARAALLIDQDEQHTDDLHEVDDLVAVARVGDLHVHLEPTGESAELAPVNGWLPLPAAVLEEYRRRTGRA